MKCKTCGYIKNSSEAVSCGLCGAKLEPKDKWASDDDGPPTDVRFGASDQVRQMGAAKKIDTQGPSEDQIVYAGDFAIVYAFAYQGGHVILKPGEVFTFGRGDAADHKIDSKMVSRRHARVHWGGVDVPTPEIVDLDSKNGIEVNGVPVKKKTLDDGDELTIGPFSATLRVLGAKQPIDPQLAFNDRLGATTVTHQRLHGEVKLISIPWLLNHLERQKESGTLTIEHPEHMGYVSFISGVAIAAAYGRDLETTGAPAIKYLSQAKEGRFTFSPTADAAPQSIGKTIKEILGPPPGRRRPPPKQGRPGGPSGGRRRGPPPRPRRPPGGR